MKKSSSFQAKANSRLSPWLLGLCLSGPLLLPQLSAASAPKPANKPKAPQPSLLEQIRELVGIGTPSAVGGSRSSSDGSVCVILPGASTAETRSGSNLRALISQPTIVVRGPLNELRLENQDGIRWQKLASSTKSIEGPIAWPIQPLSPNQTLTLRVRPKGASGGDFASYSLVGSSSEAMAETEAKIRKLGSDPQPWQGAIQSALNTKQQGLALALLFSDKAPEGSAIKQLQSTVIQRACR
jgi:hypothetical protein